MFQFTGTTEKDFETLIVEWLTEHNGYELGTNADYDKEFAIDETRLLRFLEQTLSNGYTLTHTYFNSGFSPSASPLSRNL